MKVSCTQENLKHGVTSVGRVVGVRGTLPILSNILLATDKGRLKLSGTDLEIGIISYIGAKIEKEGSITIPARLLTDFISSNPDKTINLEINGTTVTASSDHVTAHLNGLPATDFPLIPEVTSLASVTLPGSELKEAINQVCFAAALDNSRPILTGVYVKIVGSDLLLAATDSYRLAEKKITLKTPQSQEISVVVPARTLQEVGRLLEVGDADITMALALNQVSFSFGQTTVVSRVLEGTFPDYEQIIPTKHTTESTMIASELQNALKLGSTFAREMANNVRLKIEPEKPLQVIAHSPQVGDTTTFVDAEIKGESLEIAFNAKFLLDVVAATGTKQVKLFCDGSLSPAIIKPVNQQNYRALVMPLKLDES